MSHALPILPNGVRQDGPHDAPMAQCAFGMPLFQMGRFAAAQDGSVVVKGRGGDLVLGEHIQPSGGAAEPVGRVRVAEGNRDIALTAEKDHVGKVIWFGAGGRGLVFAEDATGREDGVDGAMDDGSGWHGDVPGIVDGDDAVRLEQQEQA